MKMTKKIMSLAIVFAMVMAMSVSVFAAETGSITISDAVVGETYNAYKIFDVVYSGDNYAYTIATSSKWASIVDAYKYNNVDIFTLTASATNPAVKVVTVDDTFTGEDAAADFAAYLKTEMDKLTGDDKITVTKSATADTTTVSMTGLDLGYYFVDTTLGSLCSLDTTNTDAKIQEKNEVPTLTKKVLEDSTDTYGASNTVDVIDTVYFEAQITVTKGNETIILHDQMDAAFSNATIISAKVGDENVPYTTVAAKEHADCDFELKFDVSNLDEGSVITVLYSADFADTAATATAHNNYAWLSYGENDVEQTNKQNTKTYTYEIDVFKYTNGENSAKVALANAEFVLKREVEKNQVKVTEYAVVGEDNIIDSWTETKSSATTLKSDAEGNVSVIGLDAGEYKLEETKAPDGYNLLAKDVEFEIVDKNLTGVDGQAAMVEVLNQSGTELPSTGGIGTTIFYALGGLMAVGAGVLLVAKKRMEA